MRRGLCAPFLPALPSPLMRMPREAATPVPTMTAVGVANPSAQGQAMTTTAMPKRSAKRKGVWPRGSQESGKAPVSPQMYLGGRGSGEKVGQRLHMSRSGFNGVKGITAAVLRQKRESISAPAPVHGDRLCWWVVQLVRGSIDNYNCNPCQAHPANPRGIPCAKSAMYCSPPVPPSCRVLLDHHMSPPQHPAMYCPPSRRVPLTM